MRSLSLRFLFSFIAIIVITTLLAGVPAYISVRAELDRQAWTRVLDGGRVTMALLETEKDRLENLAILVAQRPTLQNLIQGGDFEALSKYLQTFQVTVGLDILVINDEFGKILANGLQVYPVVKTPFPQEAVFQTLIGIDPQLALLVTRAIPLDKEQRFYVTVGITLDDEYTKKLANETGFEHSFLLNEQRVSTTLFSEPTTLATDAIERAYLSKKTETASLKIHTDNYYIALVPLLDAHDQVAGMSEIVLPIEDLLLANQKALLVLILSTMFVSLAACGLATYLARWLTAPLKDLTHAAIKISQGDLNSPIHAPKSPSEISTLATAFEKSREATLLALERLSRANNWSETLIQSIVEGIVTMDNQGIVTSFNSAAEHISGWKSSGVLGKPITQIFIPVADGDDLSQYVRLSYGVHRVRVKTCDGREVTLAVTSAPMQSPNNGSYQMALVLRDVSEEDAARRLRSYFLANISHEFRTPLTALNASVELLLEDIEKLSLAEIAELLNSIHLSVTGLQTLIDNLLESTSIEAGRFRIRCCPTDFGDVIANAFQVMKPLLERRKQNLSLSIPAHIPLVNADPTRLTQVLVNLLSNASKYSPMETTIELRLENIGATILRISVSDQGPGIPTPDRAMLYLPFTRLGESEKAQYGIGLGLSVVRAIVEAHHGQVGMEERPGGGSIFWFTIPLQEEI